MKKKFILGSVIFFCILIIWFLFTLPALNFHEFNFAIIFSLILSYAVGMTFVGFRNKLLQRDIKKGKLTYVKSQYKRLSHTTHKVTAPIEYKYRAENIFISTSALSFSILIGICILCSIGGSKLFAAKTYARQLPITQETEEDFESAFTFDTDEVLLPAIDKDLAFKLAQAKLSTYGAQYTIDIDNFTIISVNRDGVNSLIRVAPLEYSGLFVSIARVNKGTIGYIEVDVVKKEAKLVEIEQGLKYMPSSFLFKNLNFHIRMGYPNVMVDDKYFEIDDEGNPFWVIPTYTKKISMFQGSMPTGVIVCNPIDGKMQKYDIGEEPEWVDRVVQDSIVAAQADNALKYERGFFNATFGQKSNVFQLSDGYNYFIRNGRTYYVSCITSPNENDQTSIGFLAIDLKNKEAKKYLIPGITEMRAREIAMQNEIVKAQALEATWPILIDYKGVPTYYLVLKNEVQDQRSVLINVENGSLVAMEKTLEEAQNAYNILINESSPTDSNRHTFSGQITQITENGSNRYFKIEGISKYFIVPFALNETSIFMSKDENVEVICIEYADYYQVIAINYL